MMKLTTAQVRVLKLLAEADSRGSYRVLEGPDAAPGRALEAKGLAIFARPLYGITQAGLDEVALIRHVEFRVEQGDTREDAVRSAHADRERIVLVAGRAHRAARDGGDKVPEGVLHDGTVVAEDAPLGVLLWPVRASQYASNFTLERVEMVRTATRTYVRWVYESGRERLFALGETVAVKTAEPLQ